MNESQAEKASNEFRWLRGSPFQESVHAATWRDIKRSTAGFSQLQGMDKITAVRGGQNNGGKLSEIFLHSCRLLRKSFETEC